jgi:hypothetical protein
MTAFDLRSKLIDKRFKNSQLEDDKKCERLNFSERLIPTLKQTQAFVRQYRKANGVFVKYKGKFENKIQVSIG